MIKQFWKPLTLIFITGLLSVTWYSNYAETKVIERLPDGTQVREREPEFTGTKVEGETVQLSDYHGKIVLINDFATWCGPCLFETPHLVDMYNLQQGDFVVLGLNLGEDELDVAGYRDQFNVTYPLIMDTDGTLTEIYRPLGLPTSWFIDGYSVIRFVYTGPMTMEMIDEILNAICEGRKPDVFAVAG